MPQDKYPRVGKSPRGWGRGEKLTPPAKVSSLDKPVENESHNDPLSEVPSRGRRDHARCSKDGREKDIAERASWEFPRHEELDGGTSGADEPKPVCPRVEGASSFDLGGLVLANQTFQPFFFDGGLSDKVGLVTNLQNILFGPTTPQITEALKKVFALGQVRPSAWSLVQIPLMLPRRKLYVAIWTRDNQVTAKIWAANMVRGGIFM